jgi:hypothetical protein
MIKPVTQRRKTPVSRGMRYLELLSRLTFYAPVTWASHDQLINRNNYPNWGKDDWKTYPGELYYSTLL